MPTKAIEAAVQQVIRDFCQKLVRGALAHARASLATYTPGAESTAAPVVPSLALVLSLPAPPPVRGPVHAPDHVDRLVELVRSHPWPPQSRELQVLLGVRKDPFLRIMALALEAGLLVRTGRKNGVRYHLPR